MWITAALLLIASLTEGTASQPPVLRAGFFPSLAGSQYPVLRDSSFELGDTAWAESTDWDLAIADRRDSAKFHEGAASGLTGIPISPAHPTEAHAVLSQRFHARKLAALADLQWWWNVDAGVAIEAADYFAARLVSEGGDTLCYFCRGGSDALPPESTLHQRVIELELPPHKTWHQESVALREDWTNCGFPDTSCLTSIALVSVGHWTVTSGWQRQFVNWDDTSLPSSQPDRDWAVRSIDSPGQAGVGAEYVPAATITNQGADPDGRGRAVCTIRSGTTVMYEDTVEIAPIGSDSATAVTFRGWIPDSAGSAVVRVESELTGDQVPGNDTLSKAVSITLGIGDRGAGTQPGHLSLRIAGGPLSPGSTRVIYHVPGSGELALYASSGRLIRSYLLQGDGQLVVDLDGVRGVYFLRLSSGALSATAKIVKLD